MDVDHIFHISGLSQFFVENFRRWPVIGRCLVEFGLAAGSVYLSVVGVHSLLGWAVGDC